MMLLLINERVMFSNKKKNKKLRKCVLNAVIGPNECIIMKVSEYSKTKKKSLDYRFVKQTISAEILKAKSSDCLA